MSITEAIYKELEIAKIPPEDINRGSCANFAIEVKKRCNKAMLAGDSRLLYGEEKIDSECIVKGCGHIWLTDGKKHYDAECPEGIAHWSQLPYFD